MSRLRTTPYDSFAGIIHTFKSFAAAGVPLGFVFLIKLVLGLLLIKVFTSVLSVHEFGVLSQMMAVTAILSTVAGGAQTHGLIKILSTAGANTDKWDETLQCAHAIHYIFSGIACGTLVFFSEALSNLLFQNENYQFAIYCLAFGIVFAGFNNLQISALSAAKNIRWLALSQSLGVVTGSGLIVWLTVIFGLHGAMAGFAMLACFNAVFSFTFASQDGLIINRHRVPKFAAQLAQELMGYSAALMVAISMMPGAHIFARWEIARVQGWEQVGLWQGIARISDMIVQLYGTFYNNFVLAVLSGLKDQKKIKQLLLMLAIAVSASAIVIYTVLFIFGGSLIPLLLSTDYVSLSPQLGYQFLGDVLRIIAAIGSYYLLSQNLLSHYVLLEVIAATSFVLILLNLLEVNVSGAALITHMVTYAIVLVCALIFVGFQVRQNG